LEQFSFPPLRKKIVKALLEAVILINLRDDSKSSYDILLELNRKFDIFISPGSLYSTMNSMERDGYIKGKPIGRARVYDLTEKGRKSLDKILNVTEELEDFIQQLLS
jgi:DNA-binding PadR family transcriptional regulator